MSSSLCSIKAYGRPLDIAGVTHRDNHILIYDQVLNIDILHFFDNFGSPLIPISLAKIPRLLLYDIQDKRVAAQNGLTSLNILDSAIILIIYFIPFQTGQPLQSHIQNGLSLGI